jgi:Glycosyl transferase family 2
MRAAILFLCWNRFEYTKKSLMSIIENSNRSDYELNIWDNGSTDEGMLDWLKQICIENKFSYLFFKRNEGLTRAMNNQMRIMDRMDKFDVFCHIANDIIVPENWLNGVFEAIQSKKVGAVGLNLENKITEPILVDGVELEKITPDGCIGGMHYCIPKWMYDLIGGFKHVSLGYGQQDANMSLQIKMLPLDVWDYYLPLKKYKGEHLGETGKTYDEYERQIRERLRKSGSDRNAGRSYRGQLRKYRSEFDSGKITAEQLIAKIKDNDPFLFADKSQLKETNILDWIE